MNWRLVTWLGALLALVGVVALIWIQVDVANISGTLADSESYRWQVAMGPLQVVALGVLVTAAGRFLETRAPD